MAITFKGLRGRLAPGDHHVRCGRIVLSVYQFGGVWIAEIAYPERHGNFARAESAKREDALDDLAACIRHKEFGLWER